VQIINKWGKALLNCGCLIPDHDLKNCEYVCTNFICKQTVSDKVHCQEGNSPDLKVRFKKFFYEKELLKFSQFKGRLRIGHPLKNS